MDAQKLIGNILALVCFVAPMRVPAADQPDQGGEIPNPPDDPEEPDCSWNAYLGPDVQIGKMEQESLYPLLACPEQLIRFKFYNLKDLDRCDPSGTLADDEKKSVQLVVTSAGEELFSQIRTGKASDYFDYTTPSNPIYTDLEVTLKAGDVRAVGNPRHDEFSAKFSILIHIVRPCDCPEVVVSGFTRIPPQSLPPNSSKGLGVAVMKVEGEAPDGRPNWNGFIIPENVGSARPLAPSTETTFAYLADPIRSMFEADELKKPTLGSFVVGPQSLEFPGFPVHAGDSEFIDLHSYMFDYCILNNRPPSGTFRVPQQYLFTKPIDGSGCVIGSFNIDVTATRIRIGTETPAQYANPLSVSKTSQ